MGRRRWMERRKKIRETKRKIVSKRGKKRKIVRKEGRRKGREKWEKKMEDGKGVERHK